MAGEQVGGDCGRAAAGAGNLGKVPLIVGAAVEGPAGDLHRIRLMGPAVAATVSASWLRRFGAGGHAGVSMVRWPKATGFALLVGAATSIGVWPELHAATSATPDILSSDRAEEATSVDVSPGQAAQPAAPGRRQAAAKRKPAVVDTALGAVADAGTPGLFGLAAAAAKRRGGSAGRAGAPPPPAGPERPALALIGAVVSDSDAIAVFLDRTSQKIVRLRPGETHAGWVLSAVLGREVTFKKADQTETIAIQRQEGAAGGAAVSAPGPAVPAIPASGGFNTSYAPFTPRSTPKNRESDGL